MFSVEENLPCGRLAEVQEDERSFCPVHIFSNIFLHFLWVLGVHVKYEEHHGKNIIRFTFSEVLLRSLQNCMTNPRRRIKTTRQARAPTTWLNTLCDWGIHKISQHARSTMWKHRWHAARAEYIDIVTKSHLKDGKLGQLRIILFFYHSNLLPTWFVWDWNEYLLK